MTVPTESDTYAAIPIFRMADSNGDGSGTKNIIGDMTAGGGVPIKITAKPDESINVFRLTVLIEDSVNFSADNYGNLGAPLTTGIFLYKTDNAGTKVHDITDPDMPVKSNLGWSTYCHDVQYISFGAGNDAVTVRWTFFRAGRPLLLQPGESLVVDLNDDFTGLINHYFQFQGVRHR